MIRPLATLLMYLGTLTTLQANAWRSANRRPMNDAAAVQLAGLIGVVFLVVSVILSAVIGLRVIAAMAPTYADSVSDIATVFNTTSWGDQTADDIAPIFAMVVAIAGLLGLVGLVFLTLDIYRRNRSSG